jgi:beta-N-acetylhexosaminidase
MSTKILQEILRKQLGYRNAIITDDMEMKAITKNYGVEDAAVQAVKAGCNILLYCHTLETQMKAFEGIVKAVADKKISEEMINKNYEMVIKVKKESIKPFAPVDVTAIGKSIGHPEHLKLAKQIARKEIPPGLAT